MFTAVEFVDIHARPQQLESLSLGMRQQVSLLQWAGGDARAYLQVAKIASS